MIADLMHQAELNHRREELLRIAQAADPAVQKLALVLQQATMLLQQNIVLARSQAVSELEAKFVTMKTGDPQRSAVAKDLLDAASSEQSAAALKVDLTAFGRAHQKMIESLANPKASLKAAISEISALATELNNVKTALAPKKGGASA